MKCSIHNIYVINAFQFLCLYRNQLYQNCKYENLSWSPINKQSLKLPKGNTYPFYIKVLLGLEDGLIGQRPSMQQSQEGQQEHQNNAHHSVCLWSEWSSDPKAKWEPLPLHPQDIDLQDMCATPPKTSPTKQIEQSSSYRSIDSNLCLFVLAETLTNHMILLNNWIINYSNSVAYVRVKMI